MLHISTVRLESFTKPYPLCQSIFQFVHNSSNSQEYKLAEEKVCQTHFQLVQKNIHVSTKKQSIDPLNRGSRFGKIKNEGMGEIRQRQIGRQGQGPGQGPGQGQGQGQGPIEVDLLKNNRYHRQESEKSVDPGRSARNINAGIVNAQQKKHNLSGRNRNGSAGRERGSNSPHQQTLNNQYQSTESSSRGNEIRENENLSRKSYFENQYNNVSIFNRNESRKLRLKWSENPKEKKKHNVLEFLPEILSASIEGRIKQYHIAYNLLPLHIQSELDSINNRLKKFGYSLEKGTELWSKYSKSSFDPWT